MKKRVFSLTLAVLLCISSLGPLPTADAAEGWFAAWRNFVLGGGYHSVDPSRHDPSFCLHDLNRDGVPELLVFDAVSNNGSGYSHTVYTLRAGKVVECGSLRTMGGDVCRSTDSAYPGIFTDCYYHYAHWADYFTLDGTTLTQNQVLMSNNRNDPMVYVETFHTQDSKLDQAYQNRITLGQYTQQEIREMGWDTFVGMYFKPCGGFYDVYPTAYYAPAVSWAVDRGVTSGVDEGLFGPNEVCTRAQTVTFLWRAAGEPAPRSRSCPFADVPKNAYYYDAVLWAVENKITSGTGASTFGPNEPCVRAQVVTFLYRAAGEPRIPDAPLYFRDVPPSAYYAEAVRWAVAKRITAGTSDTTFSPMDPCTRAQIVTFLYRSR